MASQSNGAPAGVPQTHDEHEYFATNPRPATLSGLRERTSSFVARHTAANRRVALVTSGGTTVPLENQTVRFIDNFSAGTRGATSAEAFLEAGYAVIFLHRQFSLLPYSRHYSHSTNCFLDYMSASADGEVVVSAQYQAQMAGVLARYQAVQRGGTLLLLPFTTVNEYLWALREIAMLMHPLGARGLFYLAAAVSDFFVPAARMAEHKIQSSAEFHQQPEDGGQSGEGEMHLPAARMDGQRLMIDLDPVPKFLKQLVDVWAPRAMIVSFKLETDAGMLAEKARGALRKYAHHLVIGNLLETRKWEVLFVSGTDGEEERWVRVGRKEGGEVEREIEGVIVPEVAKLHEGLIMKGDTHV